MIGPSCDSETAARFAAALQVAELLDLTEARHLSHQLSEISDACTTGEEKISALGTCLGTTGFDPVSTYDSVTGLSAWLEDLAGHLSEGAPWLRQLDARCLARMIDRGYTSAEVDRALAIENALTGLTSNGPRPTNDPGAIALWLEAMFFNLRDDITDAGVAPPPVDSGSPSHERAKSLRQKIKALPGVPGAGWQGISSNALDDWSNRLTEWERRLREAMARGTQIVHDYPKRIMSDWDSLHPLLLRRELGLSEPAADELASLLANSLALCGAARKDIACLMRTIAEGERDSIKVLAALRPAEEDVIYALPRTIHPVSAYGHRMHERLYETMLKLGWSEDQLEMAVLAESEVRRWERFAARYASVSDAIPDLNVAQRLLRELEAEVRGMPAEHRPGWETRLVSWRERLRRAGFPREMT